MDTLMADLVEGLLECGLGRDGHLNGGHGGVGLLDGGRGGEGEPTGRDQTGKALKVAGTTKPRRTATT
jgi:hypothetical protein